MLLQKRILMNTNFFTIFRLIKQSYDILCHTIWFYTRHITFTHYWVPRVEAVAEEHSIPLKTIHIISREQAQNTPAPVTTYALFKDGEFLTQGIQSDKKFLKLAGVQV